MLSNARSISADDLTEALEDYLYLWRSGLAEVTFRKTATDYLSDWASPERGWLRTFYQRQEELSELLTRVLALPAVSELKPDVRTRLVHHDWLEAGGTTQRMVAQLSQQLRRFLDDQMSLENHRIMDILRNIESKVLANRCSRARAS